MKPTVLLFAFVFTFINLHSQNIIRHQFEWEATPLSYRIGDDFIVEKWVFKGAVFDDQAPSHPHWIHRFPVNNQGKLDIEIVDIRFENFSKTVALEDENLRESIQFYTNVTQSHEGYYAKIACVPYIKVRDQYQRITSMTIRATLVKEGNKRGNPPFNSVLSNGNIYKIAISATGVHQLSYSFLKNDLGISELDNIDPRQLKIYGNGGGLVPYDVNEDRAIDLVENAIQIIGEEDGRFDSEDYILFYAESAHKWQYNASEDKYSKQVNIYDEKNYYFIKTGDTSTGKRITNQTSIDATEMTTNSYDGLFRYEKDLMNILHEIETTGTGTGQHWYADFFKFAREKNYDNIFQFPGLITSEPVLIQAEMALRATAASRFYLDIGSKTLQSTSARLVPIGEEAEIYGDLAYTTFINGSVQQTSENMDITLRYPHVGGVQSSGWLDFIQARARLNLNMAGDEIRFSDSRTLATNSATFILSNTDNTVKIWDITKPQDVKLQLSTQNENNQHFGVNTNGVLKTFTAFKTNADFHQAAAIGQIDNQNLHADISPQMLIIYHPDFEAAAIRLTEHRQTHSQLDVKVYPAPLVYNEFSSGRFSPTAIRDFAKNLFEQDGTLRYLLLIGDGSFDNRDIYTKGTNFLPVYERDANHEIEGYPADDYFGIFQNNYSHPLASDLNIAVGRLPVKTLEEANQVVSKIIGYETEVKRLGNWQNQLTFLGDDEDRGGHSDDADQAAELVRSLQPMLNENKLFFDLFPQESTPAGDRFPRVEEELNRAIFKGSLVTTYHGHGGPRGWGQERILTIPMIRAWKNQEKLSLFITATCSFGDFDNFDFISAAEELLLHPTGGAIALFTTTRPVYPGPNSQLTDATFRHLLDHQADGSWPRLGDVIRNAKNSLSSNAYGNSRKFMLMGDPAQEIALPRYKVITTSLNGQAMDINQMDTLSTLEEVIFTGKIVDLQGQLLNNFNGLVYPTIYDKRVQTNTLRNDPEASPLKAYAIQKNILFRGKATVINGEFSFSFVVPKDINYAYGQGKISYYAADKQQSIDAAGYEDRFIIGGSNPDGIIDNEAPIVEVFLNSDDFIAGSIVDTEPTLVVKLSDDNGINVTANSIGHDLEGFLNEDTQNSLLLNDFYEANDNDYTKGSVRFPLQKLEAGKYSIRIRAWDVANNMGEGTTEFIVAGDGKIALKHVLNYPNPFTDHTCFQFDSSTANEDLEVNIQVFTISGRLVKTINTLIPNADGSLRQDDCIEWNGKDDYGDQLARGVYLYKVNVRANNGVELVGESDFEKLVILK